MIGLTSNSIKLNFIKEIFNYFILIMESIIANLELNDNFTITGEKDQVLQLLLKKNESIICKKNDIYYLSSNMIEETQYYKILSVKEKNLNTHSTENQNQDKHAHPINLGVQLKNSNLVRLKNVKNNFEYVGLYNAGKILTINPFIYKELFIRYDTLLAFTDSIEFYENKQITKILYKFQYHENLFNPENIFYQVHSTKLKDDSIEKFSLSDYHLMKEHVFLCSESKCHI
jgi:hypothetical protein